MQEIKEVSGSKMQKTRYNLAKKNERRYKSKCSVRDRGKEKRGRGVGEKGREEREGCRESEGRVSYLFMIVRIRSVQLITNDISSRFKSKK